MATSEVTALVMKVLVLEAIAPMMNLVTCVTNSATFEETLLIQAIVLETFQVEVVKLGGVLKDTLHEGSSWQAT